MCCILNAFWTVVKSSLCGGFFTGRERPFNLVLTHQAATRHWRRTEILRVRGIAAPAARLHEVRPGLAQLLSSRAINSWQSARRSCGRSSYVDRPCKSVSVAATKRHMTAGHYSPLRRSQRLEVTGRPDACIAILKTSVSARELTDRFRCNPAPRPSTTPGCTCGPDRLPSRTVPYPNEKAPLMIGRLPAIPDESRTSDFSHMAAQINSEFRVPPSRRSIECIVEVRERVHVVFENRTYGSV